MGLGEEVESVGEWFFATYLRNKGLFVCLFSFIIIFFILGLAEWTLNLDLGKAT